MNAPDWDIGEPDCPDFSAMSDSEQERVVDMAVHFLWLWTQRVYGLVDNVVRPCRSQCQDQGIWRGTSWASGKILPVLVAGQWESIGCGRCGDDCGCETTPALRLPGTVHSITEILVDGEVLPQSAYRVDDHRFLVRLDGGAWPTCQQMNKATTEPGTWQVSYKTGVEVDEHGKEAARALACQFAKAIKAPKSCDLPQRIQQVTRQGVTVTVMDDFKSLEDGKTGIWMIDSWVASVTKPRLGGSVHSPDIPRPRVRRTTWSGTTPPNYYGGGY